jgi:hypothetical protein
MVRVVAVFGNEEPPDVVLPGALRQLERDPAQRVTLLLHVSTAVVAVGQRDSLVEHAEHQVQAESDEQDVPADQKNTTDAHGHSSIRRLSPDPARG